MPHKYATQSEIKTNLFWKRNLPRGFQLQKSKYKFEEEMIKEYAERAQMFMQPTLENISIENTLWPQRIKNVWTYGDTVAIIKSSFF